MGKLKINNMNKQTSEQEQSFLNNFVSHLKHLLDGLKNKNTLDQDARDFIVSNGPSDIEKQLLRDMCEENHIARQRLKELREARHAAEEQAVSFDHNEWLETLADTELTKAYQEIGLEATKEDKTTMKQFLSDRFMEDIDGITDDLDEEMTTTANLAQQENGKEESYA